MELNKENTNQPKSDLVFGKENFKLMFAGIAIIILGFFIMLSDTEPYGFGFKGITLGPICIVTGFIVEFFAIFTKSKN